MNKFKLDTKAFKNEVLKADWMKEAVVQEAQKRTDSDSHVKAFIGFDRAQAIIYPNTREYK